MHFESEGMSLWFGTDDTPVPNGAVPEGTESSITIAIQPIDASNKVEVRYRNNQGVIGSVTAKWLRNVSSSNTQYFRACLPVFNAEESIEYSVICRRAGRQVPSPAEAENYAGSFTVTRSSTEAARSIAATASLPSETVAVNSLLENISPSGEVNTATSLPFPSLETRIETIGSVLTNKKHQQTLGSELRKANGDLPTAMQNLTGKLPAASLQKIDLAHSLADLADDHIPVVKALAQQPELKSLRDIARSYNVEKLAMLIDPKVVPPSVAGETDDETKRNFAVNLNDKLFAKEPTAVLQRMIGEGEIPIADANLRSGVANFLGNQPDFNILTTSIDTAIKHPEAFKNIAAEHQDGVVEHLQTLQQALAIDPTPKAAVQSMQVDRSFDRIATMTSATAHPENVVVLPDDRQIIDSGSMSLQHTISYQGDVSQAPVSSVRLAFHFPVFDYVRSDGGERFHDVSRTTLSTDRIEIDHELSSKIYRISTPVADLVGNKQETILNFATFTGNALNTNSISDLAFDIPIQFAVDSVIFGVSTLPALYGIKLKPRLKGRATMMATSGNPGSDVLSLLKDNIFLVNKEIYEGILPRFKEIAHRDDDLFLLLTLMKFLGEADIDPQVPGELDANKLELLDRILAQEGITDSHKETAEYVAAIFNNLFDFPIYIPAIETIKVAGTFEVKMPANESLVQNDLRFYELSLEYLHLGVNNLTTSKLIQYDWSSNNNPINANKIAFSFSGAERIIPSAVVGSITVRVKAFDGQVLWTKDFESNDHALQEVVIVVSQVRPATRNPTKTDSITLNSNKKLRGQVIELTKQCALKDLTVIVQAKKEGDEIWRVVAATNTDASGNFSLPYPYGEYTKAQAIVSLTPDSPADIPIVKSANQKETISDDFLYLLVTNPKCPEIVKTEDCDCNPPKKASRLPDHSDLINSDEYTQDIGGSCVNLSTPNRTLSEFSYHAIVRTSDPDVTNYTLIKNNDGTFDLKGGQKTIKRAKVSIDNPICWQDAPNFSNNQPYRSHRQSTLPTGKDTTFYQAVEVATGHVLHYKSEFKADGYSLGDLLYSLALAPGQKKQIVVLDSVHSLQGTEVQGSSQGERLTASLFNEREIANQLGGNINEIMRGGSSASTGGISAGLGVAGTFGPISATLGVAGGYSTSDANASQDSSRGTSMFFGEKLRQSIVQNAESYRQLNASVVTTVREGQQYSTTTEVVANHNHCHALTMMYFEVLRHFAVYQELVNVEECIFVPLLMTNFSIDNIYKWADVLADRLLPMSSNTYLNQFSFIAKGGGHPLLKAFDAVDRWVTKYAHVDFPDTSYDDEVISFVKGTINLRTNLERPKTKYDRIKSLPVISKTVTRQEFDVGTTLKSAAVAALTGGISLLFGGDDTTKTVSEKVIAIGAIFDQFMELDANYETVPPAQCIRVKTFGNVRISYFNFSEIYSIDKGGIDFFEGSKIDKNLWTAYASILGYSSVTDMLEYYFAGKLISEWDDIYYNDIAPVVFERIVRSINIELIGTDKTSATKYKGGERLMQINLRGKTGKKRNELPLTIKLFSDSTVVNSLKDLVTLSIENTDITYSTPHYHGSLFSGYVGDNLLDGTDLDIPENSEEKRNPKKEDEYLRLKLIEHLNSNLEYYNKILWLNLDPDRRFMLLDGFNIELYNDFDIKLKKTRSLASVVKNELLTITGNSLVFPVAAGYRVSQSYITEDNREGEKVDVSLFEHYKPLTPVPPYRISVPSKGVFLEAVQGQCDACERVKENSSQDWTKFNTDEPTAILPVQPPVPTITDWKAAFKDFAQPIVNIQNAPALPAPGAGVSGLQELLGKAGVFKDITGLDATQQNVIRTYLSNQENAKAFAEMAKGMAMQEHNTQHSDKIMDSLKSAKDSGAISKDEYGKLVKDHIQKQIDGGDAQNRLDEQNNKKQETSPIKSAVELAQGNKDVSATETDSSGNTRTIDVKSKGDGSSTTTPPKKDDGSGSSGGESIDFTIPGKVFVISQPPKTDTCWATVTTMMMNWQEQKEPPRAIGAVIKDAGSEYEKLFADGKGLPPSKKGDFISKFGLVDEPAASQDYKFYLDRLKTYGPLWMTFDISDTKLALHARLIYGMFGEVTSDRSKIVMRLVDPNDGKKHEMTFLTFIKQYENVAKETGASQTLPIQIVRFNKKLQSGTSSPSEGAGNASDNQERNGSEIPLDITNKIDLAVNNVKSMISTDYQPVTLEASGWFYYQDVVHKNKPKYKCYFKRFTNALFIYNEDRPTDIISVYGTIYIDYKKYGFQDTGEPKTHPGLGIPTNNESDWIVEIEEQEIRKNAKVGRKSIFEKGIIYWRTKDNKTYKQAIDTENLIYWGIDSVESLEKVISKTGGNLIAKTSFLPAFMGIYLPQNEKIETNFKNTALKIDSLFTISIGLTKTFFIDNNHAIEGVSSLNGKDLGKLHAKSATLRAEFTIDHYSKLLVRKGVVSPVLPIFIPIFGDIEPLTSFDENYINGWLEGFTEYNAGDPLVRFIPGIYLSLDPSRPANKTAIDKVNNSNLLLWQQHPNIPSLTEINIFEHGYTPHNPSSSTCGLWQFNNYDARFRRSNQYWIDHDLANAEYYDLFWNADKKIYLL
jgi:Papain-like cysteine protease AvrRpt2